MNEKPKIVAELERQLKLVVGIVSASPKCDLEEVTDVVMDLSRALHGKRNAYVLIACGVALLTAIESEDEAIGILRQTAGH